MKHLILAAAFALSACSTIGTPGQGMYAAYATYSIAAKGAADYAEGPTADPAVVHRMRLANDRPEVRAAVSFGRSYVLCKGSSATVILGLDCSLFDFRASTVSAYAITLRSVATALLPR